MLKNEAKAIINMLRKIVTDYGHVAVNIGASDAMYLGKQYWIPQMVDEMKVLWGFKILNVDIKDSPGVDLVCDISTPVGAEAIAQRSPSVIMCFNVLEHVPDYHQFAESLWSLVPAGGLLIISVPQAYPYHADPLDNMFRPDVTALSQLFNRPDCSLIEGETVYELHETPVGSLSFVKDCLRLLIPFYNYSGWRTVLARRLWFKSQVSVTICAFRKSGVANASVDFQ